MNFFPAELQNDGDRVFAVVDDQRILLDRETLASHPNLASSQSGRVVAGLRPEAFRSDLQPADGDQVVEGTVRFVERLGADNYLHLDAFARQERTPFLVRVSPYCVRERGDSVKAPFEASKLHFFDPETGRAI
ncbi:MAG: TOBE domain-containing protein [Acidimicrobiia bacterium]|nr:TOBE domain-containing protein [Acidimicrobiia bacterium]